jgi:hypothetical protein
MARIGVPRRSQTAQMMTGANRLFSMPTAIAHDKESNELCCHFSVSMRSPRHAATGCVLDCVFCSIVSPRHRKAYQMSL